MEPPPVFLGGAEECHSSESGWTMYIGSPIDHEEGNCDDEDNLGCYDEGTTQADPQVESDDSMASDASSGPSHYGVNPLTHFQQKVAEEEEYDEHEYYSDHNKASKNKEKQVAEKKGEKKQMAFMNSKGKEGPVQGGGKVKVRTRK